MKPPAFYTVANDRYFPGVVALVNSLRLTGHDNPVVVTDCGLTPEQRALLERETMVVAGPRDRPPSLAKCAGPLAHHARVQVLIDADVIVTKSLQPLLERAAAGCIVAFEDPQDRFFAEWAAAVGVKSIPRRPYVNAGLVFLPAELQATVLDELERVQMETDSARTGAGNGTKSDPFYYADQDALNAVIAAFVPVEKTTTFEQRLAPFAPFVTMRVVDPVTLECRDEQGLQPYVLHRILHKPWLKRTYDDAYSLLLRRLLFADDVALRLDPQAVPVRLREGRLGRGARIVANEVAATRWRGQRLLRWGRQRVGQR